MKDSTVLQIVPQLPGQRDGVGTYAAGLARELSQTYGAGSEYVASSDLARVRDFGGDRVLLHYVNYGYQKRGVPFRLVSALRELRRLGPRRVVTVFHELYASGPPWGSAFWLKPFQRRIAQSIAQLSDACVMTSETALAQLRRLAPGISVSVQPVPSGFGEPALSRAEMEAKNPHRWIICGGTALVEKSVRSFARIVTRVSEDFSPDELFVFGGTENAEVRRMLSGLQDVKWSYQPGIDTAAASEILSRASFGWLDYFHHPAAPVDALFKSSVFAALCAHGVVMVLPHRTAPLVLEQETLPGLSFADRERATLPSLDGRGEIGWKFYAWYHRRASLKHLARAIGTALGLDVPPAATS